MCEKSVEFCVTNISSHIDNVFCLFYLTCNSSPRTVTTSKNSEHRIDLNVDVEKLGLVAMLFCSRSNDDGILVSTYLGSSVLDLSQVTDTSYHLNLTDSSSRPPLKTGYCTVRLKKFPRLSKHLNCQGSRVATQMFQEAEANLRYISPFHPKGFRPIKEGLKMVHSPYYVNHMGITLPSGAFCMMKTMEDDKELALKSHRQRLLISLKRNHVSEYDFVRIVSDMMLRGVRSRHMRCLTIVADALTLHPRCDTNYTPDVEILDSGEFKGTERWEIPREPKLDGGVSFSGDCEDFAREVYQQAKEIRDWVEPKILGDILESYSAVLHMYVPTIEQGAVDSSAHSKYITYWAPYRNHIWAALHPRHAFLTKCRPKMLVDYAKWPKQKCEAKLPMIHLEGTGDVFPIVTLQTPGYIARINRKKSEILRENSNLNFLSTPDFSLLLKHQSTFYKYAIACMTDVFAQHGVLDFTYVTENKYGVNIYDWARGQYRLKPSTKHSPDTMSNIREMMTLERPVPTITTKSKIVRSNVPDSMDCLRFSSFEPIDVPQGAKQAVYKVGDKTLYEIYFEVGFNTISSESD